MGSTRESPPWHSVRPGFPSERAPLGTPSVPVFHQRGPPLALRPSRFSIREGPPWHSVRPGFPSERAHLGTPSVPVFHQREPTLALRPSRFSIRESPPWHSVRPGFPSERAPLGTPSVPVFHQRGPPLALRPSRFSIREGPLGTLSQTVPSELSAVGAKRGVRSVPMRTVPSQRFTRPSRPKAGSGPSVINTFICST